MYECLYLVRGIGVALACLLHNFLDARTRIAGATVLDWCYVWEQAGWRTGAERNDVHFLSAVSLHCPDGIQEYKLRHVPRGIGI